MSYGTVQAEKMTTESGYSLGAGNASSFKNRIINGAMTIDQRNAGASYTPTTTSYGVDRWNIDISQASKISMQQNAGSVTPPTGFANYLGYTSLAATTVGASDYYMTSQTIEGYNIADLGWGTANAKSVTLSFWVRSSLTGTFSGCLENQSPHNRNYVFSYTISAANTWEYKTITIPGDTGTTWNSTNGGGIYLRFSMGVGSSRQGTAGSWGTTRYFGAIGETQVVATNGATFYITGVQLEVGTVATSFDFRSYGTEFSLCQRYYYKIANTSDATSVPFGLGYTRANNAIRPFINFQVQMRVRPTSVETSGTASHYMVYYAGDANAVCTSVPSFDIASRETALLGAEVSGTPFPSGGVTYLRSNSTSAYLAFSAEL